MLCHCSPDTMSPPKHVDQILNPIWDWEGMGLYGAS